MAAPTTKAKRGGELETQMKEGHAEQERLRAARQTRSTTKALENTTVAVEEVTSKLEAQYRRWDPSGGCAIRRVCGCS